MFARSKILVDLPKILQSVSFYYPMKEVVTTNCHKPFKNKTNEVLRFGYLGKWSPCAYESLSTKGEDFYPHTLLYDSNFTLT